MTDLWLIRARLRRDATVAALAPLLLPEGDAGAAALADHRLVWSLMTPGEAATRDFLWRRQEPGHFLVLARRPATPTALFDVECKPFEPVLSRGDRLGFVLRANPTVATPAQGLTAAGKRRRGGRSDVVMHALRDVPAGQRGDERPLAAASAGSQWLAAQGERDGFCPDAGTLHVDGYRVVRIPRARQSIILGVVELEGVVTIQDPVRFLTRLACGFGRARSFGCGLMLIRRV